MFRSLYRGKFGACKTFWMAGVLPFAMFRVFMRALAATGDRLGTSAELFFVSNLAALALTVYFYIQGQGTRNALKVYTGRHVFKWLFAAFELILLGFASVVPVSMVLNLARAGLWIESAVLTGIFGMLLGIVDFKLSGKGRD